MKSFSRSLLAAAGALLLTLPAAADTLTLTLTNPTQTAAPGATVHFTATAAASSTNTATLFLNGDPFTLSGLSASDDPFVNTFPFTLAPGASFTGDILDVLIPATAATGFHTGYFSILGGSTDAAQNTLATANLSLNVLSATPSPVPEPAPWLLLATGLAAGAATLALRR